MTGTKLSRQEAADALGVKLVTVARYLRDGKLTPYRTGVGNRVWVDADEVAALLEMYADVPDDEQ